MLDTNDDFDQLLEDVDFEYPTNVKQIGSISKGLQIYIEDYAFTYISKFAHTNNYNERIGVLVGKPFVKDGETVLLIVGAIGCKYSKQLNGMETFTQDDWEFIEAQMRKYFSGYEVVGWLHSQPGYGVFLNTGDMHMHRENFPQTYNVLFLIDTTEKIDSFFAWDSTGEQLNEVSGYFVYYEKNLPMQEFMLTNKDLTAKAAEPVSAITREGDDVAQLYRRQERIKKETVTTQKRMQNMLAGISILLFFVSLIMGVSLIQNSDRISGLENQLNAINEMYTNLVSQVTNQNAESVFAEEQASSGIAEQSAAADTAEIPTGNTQLIFETTPAQQTADTQAQTQDEPAAAIEETQQTVEPAISEAAAEQPVTTAPAAAETKIPESYIVESGDNLSYISFKFYGTTNMSAKIMELNGIDDPDTIYYGKKLYLPQN